MPTKKKLINEIKDFTAFLENPPGFISLQNF